MTKKKSKSVSVGKAEEVRNSEGIRLVVPPGHFKKGVKERRSRKKQRSSRRNGAAPCKPGRRRGRKVKWTTALKLKVLDRIERSGRTAVEICQEEGCSPSMVSRWKKEMASAKK